jgi:hypothetical protein
LSLLGKHLEACSTEELKRKILLYGTSVWQCLYRRELFFDNDLFFPEHVYYEDNAIMFAVYLKANKIVKIDDPLYYYRTDNVSICRSMNNPKLFDRLKACDTLMGHLERLGLYAEPYLPELEWLFIRLYYTNTIYACVFSFRPIPVDKIIEVQTSFFKRFPRALSNPYYKELVSPKIKAICALLREAPRLSAFMLGVALAIHRKVKPLPQPS